MKISTLAHHTAISLVASLTLLNSLNAGAATGSELYNASIGHDLDHFVVSTVKQQGVKSGPLDSLLIKVMQEMETNSALAKSHRNQGVASTAKQQVSQANPLDPLLITVMREMEADSALAKSHQNQGVASTAKQQVSQANPLDSLLIKVMREMEADSVKPVITSRPVIGDPLHTLVNKVLWKTTTTPVIETISQVSSQDSNNMID